MVLAMHCTTYLASDILHDPKIRDLAYREGVRAIGHPDQGGDAALFKRLTSAYELLKGDRCA